MALAFLLSACDRGGQLLTTKPSVSEVAGRYTWSYSNFGNPVDSEILSKAKDAYIVLNTNGTVVFHKVPVVPESPGKVFTIQELRSGSGTFEISAMGSTSEHNIYGVYLRGGNLPDREGRPWLKRKGQALTLSFNYFDGDFTERMVFTRSR